MEHSASKRTTTYRRFTPKWMESTEYKRHVISGSQHTLVTNTGNTEFTAPSDVNEKLLDKFKWCISPLGFNRRYTA